MNDDTAEAIRYAAETLRREALALDRLADRMIRGNTIGTAASAISTIAQVAQLCRPDVIAARAAEECMKKMEPE